MHAGFFELASEILDAKLETDVLKTKPEMLRQNQKCNKNIPKEANASFELQVKQHVKRGFNKELQLMNFVLDTEKEYHKAYTITKEFMLEDITLKAPRKKQRENSLNISYR